MKKYVHRLSRDKHQDFLEEQRQDPITGERILAGQDVVFCAECGSVFLWESWEYMGKAHCHQPQTLAFIPTNESFHQHKSKIRKHTSNMVKQPYSLANMNFLRLSLGLFFLCFFVILLQGGRLFYENMLENPTQFQLSTDLAFEKQKLKAAQFYEQEKLFPEAIELYEQIISYNPNFEPAQQGLEQLLTTHQELMDAGKTAMKEEDYVKARQQFEEALAYGMNESQIRHQLEEIALHFAETPSFRFHLPTNYLKMSLLPEDGTYLYLQHENKRIFTAEQLLFKKNIKATIRSENLIAFVDEEISRLVVQDAEREIIQEITLEKDIEQLSISPDEQFILGVDTENYIHFWDIELGNKLLRLKGGKNTAAVWLPFEYKKRPRAAIIAPEHYICIYTLSYMKEASLLNTESFETYAFQADEQVALSPNGHFFLTTDNWGWLKMRRLSDGKVQRVFKNWELKPFKNMPIFSTDSQYILAQTKLNQVAVWAIE